MGVNVQYPQNPLVNVLMTRHGQKTSILTQLQKSADHKYTKTQFHTHSARFMQSLCLEWQRNLLKRMSSLLPPQCLKMGIKL